MIKPVDIKWEIVQNGKPIAGAVSKAAALDWCRKNGLAKWYGPPAVKGAHGAKGVFEKLIDGVTIERKKP